MHANTKLNPTIFLKAGAPTPTRYLDVPEAATTTMRERAVERDVHVEPSTQR
jgi:hypothetical protein